MSDENAGQGGIIRFPSEGKGRRGEKKGRSARDSGAKKVPGAKELGTELDQKDADAAPVQRARAAVSMRVAGAPFEAIAKALDYASAASARMAVERALAEASSESDWQSLRQITDLRLVALMNSLAPKALNDTVLVDVESEDDEGNRVILKKRVANDEHLAYAGRFLQVVDRHAKLHGIDAPQVISVVDPSVEEFERVISAIAATARSGEAPEGDIMALELGSDGATWEKADNEPESE